MEAILEHIIMLYQVAMHITCIKLLCKLYRFLNSTSRVVGKLYNPSVIYVVLASLVLFRKRARMDFRVFNDLGT